MSGLGDFLGWCILILWHVYFWRCMTFIRYDCWEILYMHVVWILMWRRSVYSLNIYIIRVYYRFNRNRALCFCSKSFLVFNIQWFLLCMFLRSRKKLPKMVCSTRSNDPPSSPTRASMDNTSLNVNPQQSPHTMPSHGANVDEMVGVTIPAHISSTVLVKTSTVAAVTQFNVNFNNLLVQNPWSFDSSNLRIQPYGMPSSLMIGLHNNPPVVLENLNTVHPQFYYPGPSVSGLNPQQTLTNASSKRSICWLNKLERYLTNGR